MIVYGDPHYEASLRTFLERIAKRLSTLEQTVPSLNQLRALVIEAGQLEQAVQDGIENGTLSLLPEAARHAVEQCQTLTDFAATAFLARWADDQGAGIISPQADIASALHQMQHALDGIHLPDARLTIKLPEGFAFYALYPEQYCAATLRWLADHAAESPGAFPAMREAHPPATQRRAVVVGVRSIGTTLSALVTATLKAGGWQAHRFTVRPWGNPFERETRIAAAEIAGAQWALIVDEGPGMSGSSMASVAAALTDAGIARTHLSFFPGHGGDPGSAASATTRSWWAATPRYVLPPEALRWHGRTLPQVLADCTPSLCNATEPVAHTEDLGGGLWRQYVYADSAAWPAVAAPFERPKYRCTLSDGGAVLWKFAGLAPLGDDHASAAHAMHATLAKRSKAGWTPPPLGVAYGFLATPWSVGEPLTRADMTVDLLNYLGRYIADVAGLPLTRDEQDASIERLSKMLFWNTHEALGKASAERTQPWSEAAKQWAQTSSPPIYGDGHLAPHEWLRTPTGQILKVDSLGHDSDHTMIGKQTLVWDVAGTMIEWDLDKTATAPLIAALIDAGIETIPSEIMRFYLMAYAAFRMGQCSLCAQMISPTDPEYDRLQRASAFYRNVLGQLLEP